MKPLLRKSILAAVLLLLLGAAGVALLSADRLLDGWVRPWLERQAGAALDWQVSIGRLMLQDGTLTVAVLAVEAPGLSLSVSKIEVQFTIGSLLQRRLDAVRVEQPRLRLDAGRRGGEPGSPTVLPSQPPVKIDALVLADGEALVDFGERQLRLHGIALQGGLGAPAPFRFTARLGEGMDNQLLASGEVGWDGVPELTLAELAWQGRPLIIEPIALLLPTAGETGGGGSVRFGTLDDQLITQLCAALEIDSPLPAGVGFEMQEPELRLSLKGEELQVGVRAGRGWLSQDGSMIRFGRLVLEAQGAGERWHANGSLAGPAMTALDFVIDSDGRTAAGTARIAIPDPDRLVRELAETESPGLAGSLLVEAEFSWRDGALDVQSRLTAAAPESPAAEAKIILSGLQGKFLWKQAGGSPGLFELSLSADGKPLIDASGDAERVVFALAPLNRARLALLAPELLPEALDDIDGMTGKGELRKNRQGGWSGPVQLTARRLGVTGIAAEDLLLQGRLKYVDGDLSFTGGTLSADVAKGDELHGRLAGRLAFRLSGESYRLDLERLSLESVEYLAADGLSGMGGGALSVQGKVSGRLGGRGPNLDLTGSLAAGELLAGAFYADLSNLPGRFRLTGALDVAEGSLDADAVVLEIAGLGRLAAGGSFTSNGAALDGRLELPDLAVGYRELLAPLLAGVAPAFGELELTGALAADFELHWKPEGSIISGALRPAGMGLTWAESQLALAGMDGSLPFVLAVGTPPDWADEIERSGTLGFAGLQAGPARATNGKIELVATQNTFDLRSPLTFGLAGGQVAVSDLSFGLGETGPQGAVHIAIRAVDLEQLTKELELPVMQGAVSADLGRIRYADQQLISEGEAEIEVFSGRFRLRNIRYLEPLSPYPVLAVDLDFSGLDLYQATRTFDFGEMNGVVDGYVHGLRLFGVTPSAFEARLESRSEGNRNISVKALNNLSILSQGGIQAALSSGIYRFIDFYRYRKIGLYCSLDNDNFVLRGTAVDGSDQVLVDGGLIPPRIDIVTTSPKISFKEMMRRISRVKRAGN